MSSGITFAKMNWPANKNIKIFLNWVVGPLLFLFLGWGIIQQLNQQGDWKRAAFLELMNNRWLLVLAIPILLMLLQWYVEAIKWKCLMRSTVKMTNRGAFQSVLGGIALSIVTPNRIGEFLGRALFLPPHNRHAGVAATFIGNLSQLCITLIMGEIAFLFIVWNGVDTNHIGLWGWSWTALSVLFFVVAVIAVLIYSGSTTLIDRLLQWNILKQYRERLSELVNIPSSFLMQTMLFSFFRYSLFLIQYAWVLYFLADVPWEEVALFIPIFLLVVSIIPTFSIVELGLRWQLGALLLPSAQDHLLAITLGSSLIWLINIILPAIAGTFIYLLFKPFAAETKI